MDREKNSRGKPRFVIKMRIKGEVMSRVFRTMVADNECRLFYRTFFGTPVQEPSPIESESKSPVFLLSQNLTHFFCYPRSGT
jgi:hypothetical protein